MLPVSDKVVSAAGGLIWHETPEGRLLTVVRRTKFQDYVLPKGKLYPGEAWLTAALREAGEESGIACEPISYAGAVSYLLPRGSPKIVLYWNMRPAGVYTRRDKSYPNPREIMQVCQMSLAEALTKLTHDTDRKILHENFDVKYQP